MAGIFYAIPIVLALAGLSIGDAAAQAFRSEYTVSLLGFTIARSSFDSSFQGDKFSVRGTVASAGLAQIFDSTKGSISSSGRFSGNDPRPAAYVTDYTSGRKKQKTQISFAGGNVAKTVNIPPLKKRGDEWVPVGPGDLRDVTDPISATLVRADRIKDVCRRTVKMFDGEMRVNLVLDYVSTDPVTLPGYSGDAVTCSARFVPVAGYKKDHKSIAYLRNSSKITVMFAPVGTTGIYAPVYATVGTQIGTITIRAKKFEAVD
ncbi:MULTISPECIES: DUF3108 domain-containing protein [unclassified Mesorhizobium]|jgi:hypothetical protein|uniref:DUF3108 domain-containing protein n=1 Tax=unclassified Mesorhizobium TaxID=325217 RepID=UPI0008E20BDD|nr:MULTISPECIES: DUF3108 domain-containing protein [unclassified Mesorhizobium]RJG43834.1 DUF3108 domain-containing protein [Mesorhizobium sp. DCY119]SFT48282.1 Protein of unknown function [Mesorhizobium sp. YR577]